MRAALIVEWWKTRRSPVVLVATISMALGLPAMALGFFVVAQTGGTGPLAGKAGALLVGEGWAGYYGAVSQIAAVAVFVGAGVVVSWAFGREFADRTFPSLFALPVSRGVVAGAKFIVLAIWGLGLAAALTLVTIVVGLVAKVGPIDQADVLGGATTLFLITTGAAGLALCLAWAAGAGRGYLPPIGAMILIVMVAQVAVLFGTGGWFPFAVPGLMAVAGTEGAPVLEPVHYALVPTTVGLMVLITLGWWRRAEAV